jgi:hypothetical protein
VPLSGGSGMNWSTVTTDVDFMSKTATSVKATVGNTWAQPKQQSSSQHPLSGDWSDRESLEPTAFEWSETSPPLP